MDAKLTPKAQLPRRHMTGGRDRVPYIANLKSAGRYVAKDVFEGCGVPLVLRTLLDHGCMTGRTVAESLRQAKWNMDQSVVRPVDQPLSATRGVVGLKGNLAPAGAVVKVAGVADLKFTGLARFDGEEARFETVKNKKYREGEVLVIRYAGPQGGPGMREMLATAAALYRQGRGRKVALIADGCASRATRSFCIDPLWNYAQRLGPARNGAVTRHGAAAEKACDADI